MDFYCVKSELQDTAAATIQHSFADHVSQPYFFQPGFIYSFTDACYAFINFTS